MRFVCVAGWGNNFIFIVEQGFKFKCNSLMERNQCLVRKNEAFCFTKIENKRICVGNDTHTQKKNHFSVNVLK